MSTTDHSQPATPAEAGTPPALAVSLAPAQIKELEMLRERERRCPTMLEAEARSLLRAMQEIADVTGMLPSASPAQIVNRVRCLAQNMP